MKRTPIFAVLLLCIAVGLYALWQSRSGQPWQVDSKQGPTEEPAEKAPGERTGERAGEHPTSSAERIEVEGSRKTWSLSIIDLDEAPMASFELILGAEPDTKRIQTDVHGLCSFTLPQSEGQPVQIRSAHPEWMLVDLLNRVRVEEIQLPSGEKSRIQLRVHHLKKLSGRVIDEGGKATPGADIQLKLGMGAFASGPRSPSFRYDRRGWGLVGSDKSGQDGSFALLIPQGTQPTGLQAFIGTKLGSVIHSLEDWKRDPRVVVVLRLTRLASVRGQLRVIGMAPPSSVHLTLESKQWAIGRFGLSRNREPVYLTKLLASNPFTFEGLLPGEYLLKSQYQTPLNRYGTKLVTRFSVGPGESKELIVTLSPKPKIAWDITGIVLDEQQKAVAQMRVSVSGADTAPPDFGSGKPLRPHFSETITDSKGWFRIHAQKGTKYNLQTAKITKHTGPFTYYSIARKTVEAGRKGVELRIQTHEAGVVQGRFVLPGGKVSSSIRFPTLWFGSKRFAYTPAKDGTFAIKHVPPGEHKIGVGVSSYPATYKTIQVVAGQTTPVLLELKSLQALRGRVVDDKNRPVDGAKIWINIGFVPGMPKRSAHARTNKAGWFEVTGFRPGGSFVVAHKPGYAHDTRLIKTKEEATNVRLVLHEEASLYLRHLPITGAPFGLDFAKVDHAMITILFVDPVTHKDRDIQATSYSAARPEIRLKSIPAGDYKLLVQVLPTNWDRKKKFPFLWRRMHLPAGKTTSVDWRTLAK